MLSPRCAVFLFLLRNDAVANHIADRAAAAVAVDHPKVASVVQAKPNPRVLTDFEAVSAGNHGPMLCFGVINRAQKLRIRFPDGQHRPLSRPNAVVEKGRNTKYKDW